MKMYECLQLYAYLLWNIYDDCTTPSTGTIYFWMSTQITFWTISFYLWLFSSIEKIVQSSYLILFSFIQTVLPILNILLNRCILKRFSKNSIPDEHVFYWVFIPQWRCICIYNYMHIFHETYRMIAPPTYWTNIL